MSKQLAIRIDDDLYERLKTDAERYGRTVTQSVRYWLNESLDEVDSGSFTPGPVMKRALQAMHGVDVPFDDAVKVALVDNSDTWTTSGFKAGSVVITNDDGKTFYRGDFVDPATYDGPTITATVDADGFGRLDLGEES